MRQKELRAELRAPRHDESPLRRLRLRRDVREDERDEVAAAKAEEDRRDDEVRVRRREPAEEAAEAAHRRRDQDRRVRPALVEEPAVRRGERERAERGERVERADRRRVEPHLDVEKGYCWCVE